MNQEVTIRLTREEARTILANYNIESENNSIVDRSIINKLRAQLTETGRALELRVLQGEWFPKRGEDHCIVDKKTGKIARDLSAFFTRDSYRDNSIYYFAPPELAETLSQVVTGKYRPVQQDVDEEIKFWKYEVKYKRDSESGISCTLVGGDLRRLYFFTEAQRTNFISSQVKEEPEKELFKFDYGTDSKEMRDMLNKMLTYLRSTGFKD